MSIARATSDLPHSPTTGDAFHHVMIRMLRAVLPPAVTDGSTEDAGGEQAINDAIAALNSATPEQVLLATQYFVATIQALDRLGVAHNVPNDEAHQQQCSAEFASMLRDVRKACALLFQPPTGHAAHRTEPQVPADIEQTVDAIMAKAFPWASQWAGALILPPAQPEFDLSAAEQYARANPNKAMLIRSLGRLPKKFNGPAPSRGVMNALIHGSSPALQKLCKKPLSQLKAAEPRNTRLATH